MTYRDDNFEESEGGTYEKVFTDINDCDSVYVLDLEVLQLKFPNTVTANGDGINDVFEIYGLLESEIFDDVTLIVYNRYGKQIFEQKKFESKADFWAPAANNTPIGTYFYRFIAKGKQKNLELTGVVEVFR